jgi:hypothetical protein
LRCSLLMGDWGFGVELFYRLLPRAYWRFNHPCALAQGDGSAWPAFAGSPIGCHCYFEVLDTSQVLDNLRAIAAPHVDAVQEVKPGAHNRHCPLFVKWSEPRPGNRGTSLGEVQSSRGICRGYNREPLKATFPAWTSQLRYSRAVS